MDVNKEGEDPILPLATQLKYSLSHHHPATGMSVSDELPGEQHVP